MKLRSLILAPLLVSVGCGGSGHFPRIGELASEVIPLVVGTDDVFSRLLAPGSSRTIDGTEETYELKTNAFAALFGKDLSGPATQIRVHLNEINTLIAEINETYVDGDDYEGCTRTLSSADTTLGAPVFRDLETPTFFSETTDAVDDTGKYECLVITSRGDTTVGYALGKAELAEPLNICTDTLEYYLIIAIAPNDGQSHRIYKIYYNGCTKKLQLATLLADQNTETDSTYQRYEINGNVDGKSFALRAANLAITSEGAVSYDLIQGAGVTKVPSGEDSFVLKLKTMCSADTACTDADAFDQTYCISVNTLDGDYGLESEETPCTEHVANFEAITELPYTAIGQTPVTLTEAAFGL